MESLQKTNTALVFKPTITKELYRCVINGRVVLKKFHLSGLLMFKTLEDSTTRAVFQNEMGFSFFDFQWDKNDSFHVVSIIPQLDKPALVKVLQKDMNLLLMKNLDTTTEAVFQKGVESFHRFTLAKGYAYYIKALGRLDRIENAGETSKVTTISFWGVEHSSFEHPYDGPFGLPDNIYFRHHKANFTILLKKIVPDAE